MTDNEAAEPALEVLSNSDRLLQHLKVGSFAARLVQAHCNADVTPAEAMKTTLLERLEQVRKDLGGTEN